MAYITVNELHSKILKSTMLKVQGSIKFNLCDLDVTVQAKSAIGDLFQEWLGKWMDNNGIEYRLNRHSQKFPDYYMHKTSNEDELLEIKVFDDDAGAAFDLANFDAYTRSLLTQPYKLNANYLIFSYTLTDGIFEIKNVWLKKIWEITGPMTNRPLNLHINQKIFLSIRPIQWYSDRARFKAFNNKEEFLVALDNAIKMNPKETDLDKSTWLETVRAGISAP